MFCLDGFQKLQEKCLWQHSWKIVEKIAMYCISNSQSQSHSDDVLTGGVFTIYQNSPIPKEYSFGVREVW